MEKLVMDRLSCHVTAKCNLRCKDCAVFIPKLYEINNVPEYDIKETKNSFKTYFEMVEHVRLISITGGEPMIYPHLSELLEFISGYDQHFTKLEVFTNGSVKIPDDVLKIISRSDKMYIFVDNYGTNISKKVKEIEESCKFYKVNYKVRNYFEEDMHLGGWVDRSILPEKLDDKTARYHFSKCVVAKKGGRLYTIFGRLLTFCASPYCGFRIGAIPERDVLSIDLCDEKMTIEEKYNKFNEMDNIDFNPGCAWCNGLGVYEDVERYVPAQQIK